MNIKMTDQILLAKVKKLASKMEVNELLDYELSGYMKTSEHRKMFRASARHVVIPKNKHIYIDQANNGSLSENGGSGKLMIQSVSDARKNKGTYPVGSVFSIKAYGQKNRYLGDIDKVIQEQDKTNTNFVKHVMERARKNAMR